MNPSIDLRKPWQRTRWAQALAIVLGYAAPLAVFFVQLGDPQPKVVGSEASSSEGYLFYAGVYTLIVIAILLLVLRFVCGEKPSSLNLKPGTWWKDLAGGIALVGVTLSARFVFDPIFAKYFHRASDSESGLGDLFSMLAGDPWILALFLGPILFIGVAGSEELTRIFFITRWKNISSSRVWLGLGVFLSAFLFGLNHIAQGPAGIISVTLSGLIMVLWYLRFGRIFHLIISHYFYDAIQIIVIVNMIQSGVIQM